MIQGYQPSEPHGTRRICPGWSLKKKKKKPSTAQGCEMSCGNESALWDIIQFFWPKSIIPLGTHPPPRQETPKTARSFRHPQNLVLPARGAAPWGDGEGKPQRSSLEIRSTPEKRMGSSGTAARKLVLVFSKIPRRTPLQHGAPHRQPGRDVGQAQA